jgi:hypothetical protein
MFARRLGISTWNCLAGAFIYRVANRADRTDTLLISGQWETETDVFTLEHDLVTGGQNVLECDGNPAYKCTILGDQSCMPSGWAKSSRVGGLWRPDQ